MLLTVVVLVGNALAEAADCVLRTALPARVALVLTGPEYMLDSGLKIAEAANAFAAEPADNSLETTAPVLVALVLATPDKELSSVEFPAFMLVVYW